MVNLMIVMLSATLIAKPTPNTSTKNIPIKPQNFSQVKSDSYTPTMWSISKDGIQKPKYHKYKSQTLLLPKAANLLIEDFEGDFPPLNWTLNSLAPGDSTWHKDSQWSHSGDYSSLVWWSYQSQDEWLITPPIELTGSPTDSYFLSFWTYAHKGTDHADHYYVLISNDGGTTWDTLLDFASYVAPDTGWVDTQYVFNISSYANDTVLIGFNAISNEGLWYIWAIDLVNIYYPYNHDIAVSQITSPATDTVVPGSYPIRAIFKNEGLSPDRFTVQAVIDTNGIVIFDSTFTLDLEPYADIDTSFGDFDFTSEGTTYNLTITATLSTDEDTSNNSLATSIFVYNPHHGGPDGFGYTFRDSDYPTGPTFSWIDPTSGTLLTLGDDDTITIALPFSFKFYEKTIDTLILSSNGFLAGYTPNMGITNKDLPDTTRIDIVAPWWDDLNPSAQGEVYYYVPTDSSFALIAFINVPHYGTTEGNTFQVVFYPNGDILMQYQQLGTQYLNGSTIGIQGGRGENEFYLKYTFNGDPILPHDSLAILFKYPQVDHDLALSDITSQLLLTENEPFDLHVQVANLGINNEYGVPITLEISQDGSIVYSDVITISIDTATTDTITFNVSGLSTGKYNICIYPNFTDNRPFNDTVYTKIYVTDNIIDFENNAALFSITGKWEWGTPTQEGAPQPHGGSKLIGTVLSEDYENNANYVLDRKFIVTGDNPSILYYHWYDIEFRYDGGNVKFSNDNGSTFTLLYPEGGYPLDQTYEGNAGIPNEPAFSGHKVTWELVEMPIPGCNVGDTIIIRWQFGSDASVNYPGWFIDDIAGLDLQPYYPEHDLAIVEIGPTPQIVEANSYFIPTITISNFGLSDEDFVLIAIVDSEGTAINAQTIQSHISSLNTETFYLDPVITGSGGVVYHVQAQILPVSGEDTTNNSLTQTFVTASLTREINVPVAEIIPNIDGVIDETEWADAEKIEVSDIYGQASDGVPPLTATLYIKVDTIYSRLLVGLSEMYDSSLTDYDQIGLFFDENNDGSYPSPGDNSEGNYWLVYHPGNISYTFRPLFNDESAGDTISLNHNCAISLSSQTVNYELEIPIGEDAQYLNLNANDTVGFFLYAYNAEDDFYYGWWPSDLSLSSWNNPSFYGKLYMPSWTTDVKEENERISKLTILTKTNIFTASPVLKLSVPEKTEITISLYDITGRTLINNKMKLDKGVQSVIIGRDIKPGVYFLKLSTPTTTLKEKVIITK